MKKQVLILITIIFISSILLTIGCAPSDNILKEKIKEHQISSVVEKNFGSEVKKNIINALDVRILYKEKRGKEYVVQAEVPYEYMVELGTSSLSVEVVEKQNKYFYFVKRNGDWIIRKAQ